MNPYHNTPPQNFTETAFPELDLNKIKGFAEEWKEMFPCIMKVLLFEKRGSAECRYLLYAVVDGDHESFGDYKNWQWETCEHIRDDIKHFYRDKNTGEGEYWNKWAWWDGSPDDPLPEEFIVPGTGCVLCPDPKELTPPEEGAPAKQYSFVQRGDYWEIRFGDESTHLNEYAGIKYIIFLLQNPGASFYPAELAEKVESAASLKLSVADIEVCDQYSKMSNAREGSRLETEEHLSLEALPIETLTKGEKNDLEATIQKFWSDWQQGKVAGSTWEKTVRHMSAEYGIIIRSTPKGPVFRYKLRLNSDNEKQRKRISANIKTVTNNLEADLPSLKKHLDQYIKKGNTFSYSPDPMSLIEWHIEKK